MKCTGIPAEFLGLNGRGKLKEGYAADIVVFNPETIKDRASYEHPQRYPEGISHVLVNGVAVVSEGVMTGARGGEILKKS